MADCAFDSIMNLVRSLIDDTGSGYSQSAPLFSTNLNVVEVTDTPSVDVHIDGTTATVTLTPKAALETGFAIASALQRGIREADTAIGFTKAMVTFNVEEGYTVRTGTSGSESLVNILPAASGYDVSTMLKLGAHNGGFESTPPVRITDDLIIQAMNVALAAQSAESSAAWSWDTLPYEYQQVVAYRTWRTLLDVKLGQSANYFDQQVQDDSRDLADVFDNHLKLAKRVDDAIDKEMDKLEGSIKATSVAVWDRTQGGYVSNEVYVDPNNVITILSIEPLGNGEVILEHNPIYTSDYKYLFVGYNDGENGVWEATALTDKNADERPASSTTVGLATGATLDRKLQNLKTSLIKITDLVPGNVYTFGLQVSDQNGNRYFSNEVTIDLSEGTRWTNQAQGCS